VDPQAGAFVPVTATRILDTRTGLGGYGELQANQVITVHMLGNGPVPSSNVLAVDLDIGNVNTASSGWLRVWADGTTEPNTTALNESAGITMSNMVIVQLGTDGSVKIRNAAGATNLFIDVDGYYTTSAATSAAATYVPVTESRILDTRNGTGHSGQLAGGSSFALPVAGHGGVPTSGVSAVVLDVGAINETEDTYLTLWPDGTSMPNVSSMDTWVNTPVQQTVTVQLGSDGAVDFFNSRGSTDIFADVYGYYLSPTATGAGSVFVPVTQKRLVDTRSGLGGSTIPSGGMLSPALQITGVNGVPSSDVTAVVLNVQSFNTVTDGYVTVFPDGAANPAPLSSLDTVTSWPASNEVIAQVGADGKVNFYANFQTDLVVDEVGYFKGILPPSPPSGVTATAKTGSASVSWTAPADNGSPLTAYKVTASPGGASVTVSGSPPATSATVGGLTACTAYTFTVTATNGAGTGSASTASNSVTPYALPGAPTGVSASRGNAAASVSWTAPASNCATISTYTVTASPGGASATVTGSPPATAATVSGLANGTAYTFTVTATNAAGTGPASAASNSVTPATVPSPPTGVTATAGTQQATVSWTAPANNGSAITSYTVTANPGGAAATVTGSPPATSATVTGLTGGMAYRFTVTATNGVGTGLASAASNSVTPTGPPQAPTEVNALGRPAGALVRWQAPTNTGGVALTGYTITPYAGSTAGTPVTVGPTLTSALIGGLTPGTYYDFHVVATNQYGTSPAGVSTDPVASAVFAAPADNLNGITVSVGYADSLRPNGFFPNPWQTCPGPQPTNIVFVGNPCGTTVDDGAIKIDNPSNAPVTLSNVTVTIGSWSSGSLWGTNLTVPAGGSLILTGDSGDNFDTSDIPAQYCTSDGLIPQIIVTVSGITETFVDAGMILNTGGVDPAMSCQGSRNESHQWTVIGSSPSSTSRLGSAADAESPLRSSTNIADPHCADPVDCATGNLDEQVSDLSIPGRGLGLDLDRTYNSLAAGSDGPFGYGWSSSLGMYLTQAPATGSGDVVVHEESGSELTFTPSPSGYVAPPWVLATLVRNSDGTFVFTRRGSTAFAFSAAGSLIALTSPDGWVNHPTWYADGGPYVTTLSYNATGQLTGAADGAGRSLTFSYTGERISQVADTDGRTVAYGYDSAGDLTSVVDVTGGTTSYGYDTNHLLTSSTDPNRDPATANTYNAAGQVTDQTDPAGRTWHWAYTATTTTVTDPRGLVEVQTYSGGQLSSLVKASGTSQAATWSYTYNPTTLGVATVVDPNSKTTSYSYDQAGNLTQVVDPLGRTTSSVYNVFGEPTSATTPTALSSPATETTTYTYTSAGDLLTAAAPLAGTSQTRTTSYTYGDPVHPGDVTGVTDPDGHTTTFGYDSYGQRTSSTDQDGDTTTYGYACTGGAAAGCYPNIGLAYAVTAPRGNAAGGNPAAFTTTYAYDAAGDRRSATDPLGNITSWSYDANHNLKTMTAPPISTDTAADTTSYTYNADNQVMTITRPDGTVQTSGYDANGNLQSQTDPHVASDPSPHTTTYGYDNLDHLQNVTDPLQRTTGYVYDALGRLVSLSTPDGKTTTYGLDADGETTSVSYSDGLTPNVTYSYNGDGSRATMTDGTGTTSYSYDSLGRLTAATDGAGAHVSYGYDLAGNTTSLGYPNGQTVTRGYDQENRLHTVTDWAEHTITITPDADGNTASIAYGTAFTDARGYDNADRLTTITDTTPGGATLAAFAYAEDNRDLLTTATTSSAAAVPAASHSYGYNLLDQLTTADTTPYGYDPTGQPTTLGPTNQTFDTADQLTSSTGPNGTTSYTYSPLGQRATATTANHTTTYGYDQAGRLTAVNPPQGGTSVTYAYTGNGNVHTRTAGKTTTTYTTGQAPGGLSVILTDGITNYLYDDTGQPLEQLTNSGTIDYYLTDHQGSTRALIAATGSTDATYDYDPYGNLTTHTGTTDTPLRYTGQYQDPTTNLYYLRNRYYDPSTGQFLTRDPLEATTGQPYEYVDDNPLNETDPLGLCPSWICGTASTVWNHTGGGVVNGAQTAWNDTGGKVVHQIATAPYIGGCIGGGFIIGAQLCVDVTRSGSIYVTPSAGLTTPGITGSLHAGHIHGTDNPSPCQVNSYLHGWTLTGSATYGPSATGVWGDEGSTGNSDYGDEAGVGWGPGASVMQGYGFRLPFNTPSWP
jgi:RHS repeat-associated protein